MARNRLTEYGSPIVGDAVREVKAWQVTYGYNVFHQAFENGLSPATPEEAAAQGVDREWAKRLDLGARRTLSQYFYRVHALCEHGVLDRELVATALGRERIAFYLESVDPLDQAQRRALHRPPTTRMRLFFESLREFAPDE
jgi:hypothetical protein